MTKRPTFTQAELDRAMRTAEKHGRVVEIVRGVIRIVEPSERVVVASEECGDQIDRAFGCGT